VYAVENGVSPNLAELESGIESLCQVARFDEGEPVVAALGALARASNRADGSRRVPDHSPKRATSPARPACPQFGSCFPSRAGSVVGARAGAAGAYVGLGWGHCM
jgi:hypothetical protein